MRYGLCSSFPRKRGLQQRSWSSSVLARVLPKTNSFHSPAASELLLALPKSNQKARRPTRCFAAHRAQRNALRFSAPAGRRELAHPCAQTSAPCSRWRLRCSAPRKAPFIARIRPSMDCAPVLCAHDARSSWSPLHCGGSGRDARRGGAMNRADSAVSTRMCCQRNTGRGRALFGHDARKAQCQGRVSFAYFSLHEQRKVSRLPAGRVEALARKCTAQNREGQKRERTS